MRCSAVLKHRTTSLAAGALGLVLGLSPLPSIRLVLFVLFVMLVLRSYAILLASWTQVCDSSWRLPAWHLAEALALHAVNTALGYSMCVNISRSAVK
ncbi:uncharacterized protein B0H18DRAFT_329746 [Fomitopsis serialis]|uniref:uncharacterized protein n=1 Tax=Fomitopsis serialis TaxID=139415 RepID=UPI0020083B04|nr:uncharacterized protein B0H18DRAFT_329746 [Neoantrodia serialis]KAH9926680.1 hypothetical protein B0H18DRAFT_329746 [Neoantrodia serialis]